MPTDEPRFIDEVLKDIYGPAIREQLNSGKTLVEQLGYTAPIFIPYPQWKRILITIKERLNSCYMHLRYGECDDLKEWNNHDC